MMKSSIHISVSTYSLGKKSYLIIPSDHTVQVLKMFLNKGIRILPQEKMKLTIIDKRKEISQFFNSKFYLMFHVVVSTEKF